MKEVKYILHAFLLLLAFIIILTCLKVFYSVKEPLSQVNNPGTTTVNNSKGKSLFQSKCASCHIITKDATGPALIGFQERGPWAERKDVYEWIKNPIEFMRKNEYTQNLKKAFGGNMMASFPDLSNEDVDEIINYINGIHLQSLPGGIVKN